MACEVRSRLGKFLASFAVLDAETLRHSPPDYGAVSAFLGSGQNGICWIVTVNRSSGEILKTWWVTGFLCPDREGAHGVRDLETKCWLHPSSIDDRIVAGRYV